MALRVVALWSFLTGHCCVSPPARRPGISSPADRFCASPAPGGHRHGVCASSPRFVYLILLRALATTAAAGAWEGVVQAVLRDEKYSVGLEAKEHIGFSHVVQHNSLPFVSICYQISAVPAVYTRRSRTMEGYVEDVVNGNDVSIVLMPNSAIEKQGHGLGDPASKKRKWISEDSTQDSTSEGPEAGNGLAVPLCEIHANSTRLRQCSKYFESLMSGRWTVQTETVGQSSSAIKFFLEVQTDERYYLDCFSRMYLLHRPIESVKHCLELLKVASQIEYKELMDVCLRCLSAIPWTSDEEELVHEFCVSGQYLSSASAADLRARLQLPLGKSAKQKELRTCVERILGRYLHCCLEHEGISKYHVREENREMFETAFLAIVSGPDTALIHYAMALAVEESKRLIHSIKGFCEEVTKFRPAYYLYRSIIDIVEDVSNFWWLFQFLRRANAAQAVVEVLVKDNEFSDFFLEAAFCVYCSHREFWPEWRGVQMTMTNLIMVIFEDVVGGRFFLVSSDRVTLFHQWKWIIQNIADETSAPTTSSATITVVASFIKTFPLPDQEEAIRTWMKRSQDPRYERSFDYRDLTAAHTTWLVNLISDVGFSGERKGKASHEDQSI